MPGIDRTKLRHRKNGDFAKKPGPAKTPGKPCKVEDCGRRSLAKDMCRLHYDRWRKHGNVETTARPGSPRFTPPELTAEGITSRQRSYWANSGLLGVEQDPKTLRWLWTPRAVAVAVTIKRLTDSGLPLAMAARVARQAVDHGQSEVELVHGVVVKVDLPAPESVWL